MPDLNAAISRNSNEHDSRYCKKHGNNYRRIVCHNRGRKKTASTTKEDKKMGKNYRESAKLVDKKFYTIQQKLLELAVKTSKAKFDETIEVH